MVNAGRILILAQGEWDNLTNYVPLDLVSKGETAYLARKASVGIDPETDVEMFYWQPFGSVAKIATTEVPGLVMPDGTTITIDSTGLIRANIGIADITDVDITNVADGSVIRYDLTSNKWKNVTLGASAYKGSTNAVTQGSPDLVESGAVYTKTEALNSNKQPKTLDTPLTIGGASKTTVESALAALNTEVEQAYQTDNPTETALASDDLIPFYDTSASAKKKMEVGNFAKQAISNPNLIDNAWFTINQRGQSSYLTTDNYQYTLDRWFCYYADTQMTINADGSITVGEGPSSSRWEYFRQYFEETVGKSLLGKKVTLSAIDGNGKLWTATALVPSSVPSSNNTFIVIKVLNTNNIEVGELTCTIRADGRMQVDIISETGYSITIKAIKLEIGSASTLEMDTAPNYTTELLKCMRFFQTIKKNTRMRIVGYNSTTFRTNIKTVPMRAVPTVSNATLSLCSLDESITRPATSQGVGVNYSNDILLYASYSSGHGLTDGQLLVPNSTDLYLSAEL